MSTTSASGQPHDGPDAAVRHAARAPEFPRGSVCDWGWPGWQRKQAW